MIQQGRRSARAALVVSYYPPLYPGPHGARVDQVIRHLPATGWRPILLSANESAYHSDERVLESTAAELPTAGEWEWYSAFAPNLYRSAQLLQAPSVRPMKQNTYRMRSRGAAVIASLLNPDRLVPWAPFAVLRGLPLLKRVNLVMGIGPPFTNHLVAHALHGLSRKPLVLLIDDPWTSMEHRVWHSRFQLEFQRRQERRYLTDASRIFVATPGMQEDIAMRFPALGSRIAVAPCGYEPRYFSHTVSPASADGVHRMVYAGSLRGEQYDISAFLAALHSILKTAPDLRERLRIEVLSDVAPEYRQRILSMKLTPPIEIVGYQPRDEAIRAIRTADSLLLVINDTRPAFRLYTSAKLYEYLAAGRPILALVPPDGDAAGIIQRMKAGVVVPPRDADAIGRAILCLIATTPAGALGAETAQYANDEIMRRVAAHLDELVSS